MSISKNLPKLGYFGMALIAISMGTLAYWVFSPSDVIEVKNDPVPVRTIREHPDAEGVVILTIDYCKKIDATGDVRVSFVSPSREIFLPRSRDSAPASCHRGDFPVLIPEEIPPGEYRIHFRATYRVNPLKQEVEEFDSKPLIITTSSGSPTP